MELGTNIKFHSTLGTHYLIEMKMGLNALVKHRCGTGK